MITRERVERFLPVAAWGRHYDRAHLRGDLSAGVTVGVMLIPQGMAYAMLAGLPPIHGLYAALVPLLLYALLGTSRQLAVGPVAIVALMVAAGVGTLAEPGTPEYIGLAILLALLPIALAIALVGFMESIAVAKAMVRRHRDYRLDANQELIALGGASLGGAFFQSFPVAGGFSRTAINDQAGAKAGLASMVSAAMIAITLLFLTPLFTFLPTAVLAAVILVAVAGLIDVQEMRFLWRVRREHFLMLATTFMVTLFIGIEEGIATGVLLSLAMVIYRSTRPHVAVLGRLPGTDTYHNIRRFPEAEQRDDLLIVRFDAQL